MPTLDPTEAFEHLKTSTTGEISKIFPLVGKKNKITLNKIWVDDNQHIDDLRSQADTKMKGDTWAVPIKADLTLANHDGTVVDRKTLTLAHMPKYTRRYSFIVGGNEYQVDHQFRLKSGIYPRIQANGEISAQFNAMRGASTPEGPDNWDRTLFNVGFHPEKRKMTLTYRDTNVPLYSVVKALGGTDENMKRAWGHEVFHSNVSLEPTKDLRKLYKAITRKSGDGVPEEELAAAARTAFHDMAVDPNVVEKTVGHRTERIDHNSLTMAGNRLIGISKGTHPPADRDSLEFKDLLSVGDLMAERVRHSAKEIRRKAANNLDRQTNLGQIIVPQMFRKPIGGYFTSNGTMASTVEQLNPLEMLSGHLKTTVMGKGGISSEHQIEDQMRAINPSSLGFLDPLHTPEGARTGITLHLPIGVEKEGNTLKQRALDVETGQPTFITPRDLMRNVVSFADQYHTKDGKFLMKGGKPIPRSETVKASDSGEFGQTHHSKVKYILPQSRALFDPASNLLPFLPTAQGARATMAAKQMEQAVALKHREEPLVQTVAGQSGDNKVSFEKLLGQFASHVAPVGGKVVRVQPGAVHIQDAEGKLHEVQTYDHYPLNDNQAFLHSTPVVKAGDMVQKGQLVADTNFSKNGHLTLGTNIRTAYIPYKGLNFEDGVVISESAAKKLTSEHLHRVEFQRDDSHTLDRDKFRAYHPDVISGEHAKNLGEDGVIKVGTKINPGDVLIAALKEHNLTSEDKILRSLNKTLASPFKDASERWHKDYPGVVTRVVQDGKNIKIHVKTEEPAQIGDKIVGRHANKGIITTILPDHEMPHTSDGQALHVLMNPAGVPSRINPGQLLETAASKIAQKTGKPYFVDNFKAADHDYSKEVKDDLAHHGISDTEDVYDPKTKQLLGKGFVGSQYILKLKHQVTKKTSVRSGGVEMPYDSDFAPRKGPPNSAQAMDPLSLYAMLSHGARHNLREIATWKAGGADRKYNQEFWAALQAGASLPTPKPTFAYDKFHNMIRGLGVNVEKQGNSLHLVPFTDKQVRNMSSWEVKDPSKMVIAKNMKPESDGLFSEHLGGPEGTKWGHITLNERMPNPIFEGPIQDLLGIKTKDDYERIVNGEVPIEGKRGGAAIAHALSKLDTDKELEDARARLAKATKSNRDKLNRKVKYLQALKESGLTAHDAYTQQVIPVLPPIMRPYSRRPSGELLYADVNELYKHIGQDNQQMKKFDPRLPDEEKNELRAHLYDNLRSLAGLGGALNTRERRGYRGIIQQISGKKAGEGDGSPKEGYFQRKIMKRQQDLSMRSTIVPEPSLGLDQVVLPRNLAMELYKPFVVRQLRGMGLSTPAALREVKDKGEMAHRALEHVVDERPILMKRDPVLHKYGVQAFKPVLGEGKAIKIHPLVTGGYNADFDGDTMSGYVPISQEAVQEARKMMPSENLFSPANGKVMYTPKQDMVLGLHRLSEWGKDSGKSFQTGKEALQAFKSKKIGETDVVDIGGMKTTVGRLIMAHSLSKVQGLGPEHHGEHLKIAAPNITTKILSDPNWRADKNTIAEILTHVGKADPGSYSHVSNRLKDLGDDNVYRHLFSYNLGDLQTARHLRDPLIQEGRAKEKAILSSAATKAEKHQKVVELWSGINSRMNPIFQKHADDTGNTFRAMERSGARGNWNQIKQILAAPLVVTDSEGKPLPYAITKNFAEGLDTSDYWVSLHGARRGAVMRSKETEDPGFLSKQMMQSTIGNTVTAHDCGTTEGISMSADNPEIHDRYLAKPLKVGEHTHQAGTLITPNFTQEMRKHGVDKAVVRTPLHCEHTKGICARCYGLDQDGKLPALGTNLGAIATQSLGEPLTQGAMQVFHIGAVATTGPKVTDDFTRLNQLVSLPETLKDQATLSTAHGKVEKVEEDPAVGGWHVTVDGRSHYVPQHLGLAVKQGDEVKKGSQLSHGLTNPHELLELNGINAVKQHITDEIGRLYKGKASRKNVEVVVRSLTDLSEVDHPGDSDHFLRGDRASTSAIMAENRRLQKEGREPIKHTPFLAGIGQIPLKGSDDWVARLNHSRLKDTVLEAAAKGWHSPIHGHNPLGPYAYGAEFGQGQGGEY